MNLSISFLVAIAALSLDASGAPVPDDFANGLRLQTDGDYPMYRMLLPEMVYRGATRPDLGDLRVFDADGKEVRHRLVDRRRLPPVFDPRWVAVPHFPIPSKSFEPGNQLNVTIRHNGSLVEIEQGNPRPQGMDDVVYLIDLSRLSQVVKKIDVVIDQTVTDLSAAIRIDESRDLNRWTTIVERASVISLDFAGQRLRRTVIELPHTRWPYLRLRWLDGNAAVAIDKVKASVIGSPEPVAGAAHLQVAGRIDRNKKHAVVFDIGGYFPIVKASIDLVPNTAMRAQFGSRNDPESDWRIHQTGVFYALRRDQTTVKSGPVSIGLSGHRYWYLADLSNKEMTPPLPRLDLEWVPHELVFLAEGTAPYMLAYGSGRAEHIGKEVSSLLKSLSRKRSRGMVGDAEVAGMIELGGEGRRKRPSKPLPWQRVLLWAILITGVIVVAAMALRLVRKLNAEA